MGSLDMMCVLGSGVWTWWTAYGIVETVIDSRETAVSGWICSISGEFLLVAVDLWGPVLGHL